MNRQFLQWLFVSLLALTLAGCVSLTGGGMQGFWMTLFFALLLAFSCTQVIPNKEKNDEVLPDAAVGDKKSDRDGSWERCCKDGKIDQCFCPTGVECNYGQFQDCGGGVCVGPVGSCEPTKEVTPDTKPDVKPDVTPDKKGTWEACCKDGKIDKCFCPGGAICNYGQFRDCGSGTCVSSPQGQCEPTKEVTPDVKPDITPDVKPDVKPDTTPDQQGTWQSCCKSGKVDKCFCPQGMACNYGMYKDCGGGVCVVDPRGACPEPPKPEIRPEPPPPERKGTWETCCKSGKVDKCFCPQGMACNYGMFTSCGGGTCVGPGQKCPP